MKRSTTFMACLLTTLLAGCGVTVNVKEYMAERKDRRDGVLPESKWNLEGIWQRKSTSPLVYVPVGYSGPVSKSKGMLIIDERDGKSFFVPRESANGVSPGALRGDAIKNAEWSSGSVQTYSWFQ